MENFYFYIIIRQVTYQTQIKLLLYLSRSCIFFVCMAYVAFKLIVQEPCCAMFDL